jgi:nucleoid DNA-binding protein
MIIGMTITKDDQIDAVAHAAGVTAKQARDTIDAIVGVITAGLISEGKLSLHGLGIFEVQRRGPRRVMNPSTGVPMDIPSKCVVKFRPANNLRKRVEDHYQ